MTITFKGQPNVVRIGNRWLEPGDTVCDDAKSKTAIFCDTRSLERLALRSDFESAKPTKKAVTKKEEKVNNDG